MSPNLSLDAKNKVISSVSDSLRCNLIQPHLEALSPSIDDTNGRNNTVPTLVLILAVSGGCDSMALFHAILALIKNDTERDAATRSTRRHDGNRSCDDSNHPRSYLCLGANDSQKKLRDMKVPCELHVAHFNHQQRGEASDGDEALVENMCREKGVPFHRYSWSNDGSTKSAAVTGGHPLEDQDSSSEVEQNASGLFPGSFTQDVARQWRRRNLKALLASMVLSHSDTSSTSNESYQRRWGAILTAHHRDDADETILLKLLRGSHLTNLHSMDATSDAFDLRRIHTAEKDPSAVMPDVHLSPRSCHVGYFAKPMLEMRKNDIVEYLTSNSLEWREDDSNSSNKYKRNKIRNALMPLLSEIAGGDSILQVRFVHPTVACSLEPFVQCLFRNVVSRND